MPELRKDPILGRWVIVATERGKRPNDFVRSRPETRRGFCPFCYGNEDKTPPEIMAYREPDSKRDAPGWWLRVVPNKYPALMIEGELDRRGEGMYDMMNGIGAHEVIIETPNHYGEFGLYEDQQVREIIWACRERMVQLARDKRFRYMMLFKNKGREAGASLDHPHTQLIAIPTVPKRVREELKGAEAYYNFKERCVFCDMIKQEIKTGSRIVMENASYIAFNPFASRFPFETWILPKKHQPKFEEIDKSTLPDLAEIMKSTLRVLGQCLDLPPYNFIVHTSPCNQSTPEYYHWHIEIMPKLTQVAGFEWGTGFYINPTPPEDAAEYLRNVQQEKITEIPNRRRSSA